MQTDGDILTFLATIISGGGIGGGVGVAIVRAFMRSEAKKALKCDIEKIDKDIAELKTEDEALHKRINHVENDYVQCRYCDMQHNNLENILNDVTHKLDMLIEREMR